MTIGIVGGVERDAERYHRAALDRGHDLEFHSGHAGGRGAETLRAMIARADLVIVVTDTNSHQAVKIAKRAAQLAGRRLMIMRRCSVTTFAQLIAKESQ